MREAAVRSDLPVPAEVITVLREHWPPQAWVVDDLAALGEAGRRAEVIDGALLLPGTLADWTPEDLAVFGDDRRWIEIVDGALLIAPAPGFPHGDAVAALIVVLSAACPPGLRVTAGPAVEYGATYREPDVFVYRRADRPDRGPIGPTSVVLAVEVMSPGSVTTDRVRKPREYGSAEIPHFWRVELDPEPLLIAHELRDGAFLEVGRATGDEPLTVTRPFPVTVVPAALLR